MPTPNPTTRREYKGAAAATTLQNSMSSSDTSFVLVAASNWPTGAVGKFVVTVNRGQADEEKILCDTQSSRTVSCLLANRGFDGTTAQGHAAGATVECTISAFDADEWNQHTNATSGVHGAVGPVADTSSVQTFTNKTLNGATLDAASTVGGVSGTSLAADRTAWTSYTPTLGGGTQGNATMAGYYKQVGKTVDFYATCTVGSTTAFNGNPNTLSLPVTSAANTRQSVSGQAYKASSGGPSYTLSGLVEISSGAVKVASASGWMSSTVPTTWATGDILVIAGTYEAA